MNENKIKQGKYPGVFPPEGRPGGTGGSGVTRTVIHGRGVSVLSVCGASGGVSNFSDDQQLQEGAARFARSPISPEARRYLRHTVDLDRAPVQHVRAPDPERKYSSAHLWLVALIAGVAGSLFGHWVLPHLFGG